MGSFRHTDPFFTDLSGLTLQSGVGVGPGGRLVKDEYSVGGGNVTGVSGVPGVPGVVPGQAGSVTGPAGSSASGSSSVGGSTGMDVDGEINQTIQHHPQSSQSANSNSQSSQFITGLPPNPSNLHFFYLIIFFILFFFVFYFLFFFVLFIIIL